MTGSQTDDGPLLSHIPPADERKSLADFLAPRPSRPPSLAEFLKPPKSERPSARRSSAPPPASGPVAPDGPATIELPDVEPPARPSLFSELPVPRTSRSEFPRPARVPSEGDAPRHREGTAPASEDDELGTAESSRPRRAPMRLGVADDVELDAELTSTRRWLEARRGSPGEAVNADSASRHTAEPVWNHSERDVALADEPHERAEGDTAVPMWRAPVAAVAIVMGVALLTLLTLVVRSRSHRLPSAAPTVAAEPAVRVEQGSVVPPPEPAGDTPPPPLDRDALRREARQLLVAGRAQEGVRLARQVIELDPSDSEAYVLLAAGLQDLGRWAESRQIFESCVHLAKGADTADCLYFARRGQ